MQYEVYSETPAGHEMGIEYFDTDAEAIAYAEAQANEGLYAWVHEVDDNGKHLREIADVAPDDDSYGEQCLDNANLWMDEPYLPPMSED